MQARRPRDAVFGQLGLTAALNTASLLLHVSARLHLHSGIIADECFLHLQISLL